MAELRKLSITSVLFAVLVCGSLNAEQPATAAAKVEFDPAHAEKMQEGLALFKGSVRAVLIASCVECHGGSEVESGFDLATRKGLLRGGSHGPAAIVGKSADSNVVRFIRHQQKPFMPEGGDKLAVEQIEAISRWIDLGAPYDQPLVENPRDPDSWVNTVVADKAREYWAFRPLAKVDPPPVKNEAWIRNAIDRFILAKLEDKGLTPSNSADSRVLTRRAFFDLIGLPPTPDEVPSSDYEALLAKLLASPHYGERWGRHWLDAARFAESHGFEQDYDRPHAYHFRDFVIEALNQDMPYDQFVRWQLAGDEFEPENVLALKATGFLGAGVFPTQITANEVERTRYDALDDMAATMGSAMLGLSVGCARCHDHKFDPIPQADYYRLVSAFTTTVRSNLDVNLEPEAYRIAMAAYDKEHQPLVDAVSRFEKEQLPAQFAAWEESGGTASLGSSPWTTFDVSNLKSNGGATLARLDDGAVVVSGTNPDTDWFTFNVKTRLREIHAIRIEALADPLLPKGGPGRSETGNFILTDLKVRARVPGADAPTVIKLESGRATHEQKNFAASAAIDENETSGWSIGGKAGTSQAAVFELPEQLGDEKDGIVLTFELHFKKNKQHSLGKFRLAAADDASAPLDTEAGPPESIVRTLATAAEKRSSQQAAGLIAWFRHRDAEWQRLHAIVAEHEKLEPQPKLLKIMVSSEGVTPIRHHTQGADFFNETYFLKRGDCDQKMGVAEQGFLQILTTAPEQEEHWQVAPPAGCRTSYRRRALANWITDTEYGAGHLLARVIVNRLWQHHFGRGLVATPNDFGVQGERPTHPELLDWLAAELIRSGWRLKALHQLIMTSATYRQKSGLSGEETRRPLAVDPENTLLWRQNVRRLEAEVIRDGMLAVSGTLDRTLYGQGTLDEGHTRRSIYFQIKRSKLVPMMQLFDQPEPLVSVGERPSTTIAPQALAFLNSPYVRTYAQSMAKRLRPSYERSADTFIQQAYRISIARPPDATELSAAAAFIESQLKSYAREHPTDAVELALADVCQVLFGLNEFVYVE